VNAVGGKSKFSASFRDDLLAALISGVSVGLAYGAVQTYQSASDMWGFLSLGMIAVPVGAFCALLIALPIFHVLPISLRNSLGICLAGPTILFMTMGVAAMVFSGTFSEVNFLEKRLVHHGVIIWRNFLWLFISQYDLGLAGGTGGAIFYGLRKWISSN